jgi:hypothetical protein
MREKTNWGSGKVERRIPTDYALRPGLNFAGLVSALTHAGIPREMQPTWVT